jgi:hypothetical protein
MQKYKLYINIKWEKIDLATIPETEIPFETWTEDTLIYVKEVFIKSISETNPMMLKDTFLNTLSHFLKNKNAEKIMFRKDVWDECEIYFTFSNEIKPVTLFTTSDKESDLNNILMSFLSNIDGWDEDFLLLLSLLVFSWMTESEFNENSEEWVKNSFLNITKMLGVELTD